MKMGVLQNKIDFVAFVSVTMANPNGDPLNGPRRLQRFGRNKRRVYQAQAAQPDAGSRTGGVRPVR